jgi:hypothetical protein
MTIRQNSEPFFDGEGRTVIEQFDIARIERSIFFGKLVVPVADPTGNIVAHQPMTFEIKAATIQQAFGNFDAAWERHKKVVEARQRKVAVASAAGLLPAIVDRINGKSLQ